VVAIQSASNEGLEEGIGYCEDKDNRFVAPETTGKRNKAYNNRSYDSRFSGISRFGNNWIEELEFPFIHKISLTAFESRSQSLMRLDALAMVVSQWFLADFTI
jgi:hypothetical protein